MPTMVRRMPVHHDPYALPFVKYPRLPGTARALPFRVHYLDLHLRSLQGPYSTVEHPHEHYEVIVVEDGDYRCLVNGQVLRVRDAGVILLVPGDRHEDCGGGSVRYQGVSFACLPGPTPERSWNVLAADAPVGARRIAGKVDDLLACTARLAELARQHDAWTPGLQDAVASEFLLRLLRRLPADQLAVELRSAAHSAGLAADLDRCFAANPARTLGVDEIAAALGLSKRTLTAHCHAELGDSPAKLHAKYRMDLARSLVVYSERTLADIAQQLGFSDQFHFSKVYKRVHGVPPQQHRRQSEGPSGAAVPE